MSSRTRYYRRLVQVRHPIQRGRRRSGMAKHKRLRKMKTNDRAADRSRRSPESAWTDLEQTFFESAPPDEPQPSAEPEQFDDLIPAAPLTRPGGRELLSAPDRCALGAAGGSPGRHDRDRQRDAADRPVRRRLRVSALQARRDGVAGAAVLAVSSAPCALAWLRGAPSPCSSPVCLPRRPSARPTPTCASIRSGTSPGAPSDLGPRRAAPLLVVRRVSRDSVGVRGHAVGGRLPTRARDRSPR